MIGEALFAHLRNDLGVAALVQDSSVYRIYPLVIPQKLDAIAQMPAIVYSLDSAARSVGYCGTFKTVDRGATIDCYALSYAGAHQVADAVTASLLDFRGQLGGLVFVHTANLITALDLQDIEPGLFRVSQSWSIWHSEV